MKIGITGATGFLGGHLISKLLSDGYSIKAFVIEENPPLPRGIEWVRGNLVSGEGISEFLKDVDVVIHLAGRNLPPEEELIKDNVMATRNLIMEALKHPIKQFIFTSSVAVYGKDKKNKFKETDECFPNTEYGLTKYLAEKIVQYWSTKIGEPATIFRPFNIYGPGNFKGIIYTFYSNIKDDGKVVIYGDGKQERDYLYVGDIVEAFSTVIRIKKAGIFNLGATKKYSVLEVLEVFKKVLGKGIKVDFSSNEEGKVFNINQALSLARKELNWEAKTSFEDGLKKTIEWYERH
ncbi:MAG: NAD-dependent epimerase/dehydratase [Candidatus Woesebacteria bacterium GW2011_GWB1_39_10]|uniref:NAD-dependent epimerase/dehydratase n=2 Tax=Candidatus Woeseibacteriota TaxID=1752722 RepID=A0A0G0LIT9_9BACT|nr:MAG: NAD-dependent epimerase/dehydratase [Candidatus Woesebacteria bacterium GW2011_GWB1_39_10]KKS90813.1 MAG: NAD-dependent epimerase/dehydratase [Candidatus Woesebacteria bacterium GW2011_GWA1_43_12]